MKAVSVPGWIRRLRSGAAILVFLASASARADVTLESLLGEMVDPGAIARWPQPEFSCKQASSHDRGTVALDRPGWFANNDQNQFIRVERNGDRTEKVMMDADGPGCIVRFWLTTSGNKKGILRIYLDGAAEPAIVFPAYDLLSGDLNIGPPLAQPHPDYRPDANGGNNLYLPVPYAKRCRVTWEEAGQDARYYKIDYRAYAPGTRVETFTRAALEAARPAIERTNRILRAPPDGPAGQSISEEMDLPARGARSLELPAGPAAVSRLELRVPVGQLSRPERSLRSLILQMNCDGESTVWCPASDFFGSGVGLNGVQSWYRTVSVDGSMVCRWVMPYGKSARLALVNLGDDPIGVSLRATVGPWSWDDRSMHFHAVWRYESDLKTPPHRDWNFVRLAGSGVYVGDTLALYNPIATWYGEGDEKIWVDGESFPSHVGTGTEDYYGYSYAPKAAHDTPFCGEPRIDQPMTQGHNTSTRTRNLDGIPFRRSLQFDIELISWKPTTLIYAATTYWYAFPGASSNVGPQPREAALPVPTLAEAIAAAAPPRKLGAIECETMKVISKSDDFFVGEQDMDPFGGERWSNGRQLLGKTTAAGDSVEIEWPAPDAGQFRLVLHATQAPDYAVLRFRVNGQPVAETFDGYAAAVQPASPFPLGPFEPRDGKFRLRVEIAGANSAASGARHFFGLDCVTYAGDWRLGPFVKNPRPVLLPTVDSKFRCPVRGKEVLWEEQNVYNPAAIVRDGKVYLFYRADDRSPDLKWGRTCRIGMAWSEDGVRFTRHPTPVLYPDEDEWKRYEWEGGCEDLHIVEAEDGLCYMNYTTWSGKGDTMSIATSRDLVHWTKHGPAFRRLSPDKVAGSRSGVVVSRREGDRLIAAKIDGKYWMYYTHPCSIAWSANLIDWVPTGEAVWGGSHEAGAMALLREDGILLMTQGGHHSLGAWTLRQALIDRKDLKTVLREQAEPFLFPEHEWEKKGMTGDTTVSNGLVPFVGRWMLYYGAADRVIGLATCPTAK